MTVCKKILLYFYTILTIILLCYFSFFSMAFDRCSLNDYLLTYLLTSKGREGKWSVAEGERKGMERGEEQEGGKGKGERERGVREKCEA